MRDTFKKFLAFAAVSVLVLASSAIALAPGEELIVELPKELFASIAGTSTHFVHDLKARAPDTSSDHTAITTLTVTTDIATLTTNNLSMSSSVSSVWSYSSSLPDPTTAPSSTTVFESSSVSSTVTILSSDEPLSTPDISTHPPPSITFTNSLPPIANTSTTTVLPSISTGAPYTGTASSASVVDSTSVTALGTVSVGGTVTGSVTGNMTISKPTLTSTWLTYITVAASTSENTTTPTETSSAQNFGKDIKKDGLKMKIGVCLLVGTLVNVIFATFL